MLDDSGIESEDKQSTAFEDIQMISPSAANFTTDAPKQHMAELEVAFRDGAAANASSKESYKKLLETTEANNATGDSDDSTVIRTQPPPNTCRLLQRKLELKVERAKRNYCHYQEEHAKKSQSANLIPINRLSIPGDLEQKPLVDYKSDSSDEVEEISFFPAKLKNARQQKMKTELTDTFSIQEMTIDSDFDSDDSGSQNLELLPPMMKSNILDKLKCCFNCKSYGS